MAVALVVALVATVVYVAAVVRHGDSPVRFGLYLAAVFGSFAAGAASLIPAAALVAVPLALICVGAAVSVRVR